MSNKPAKTAAINDVVAGQSAASAARPQSVKKSSASPQSQPKQGEATRSGYSKTVAQQVEAAATSQAKLDAAKVVQFGQQVYQRQLAKEMHQMLGDDAAAYFRIEIEDLSLPSAPTAGYLPAIDVAASPSAS